MHPVRRNILIRWIGYVVVVLGMGVWIYTVGYKAPEFNSTLKQRLAPEAVSLPTEEVTESIKSAIAVLRGQKAVFAKVDKLEPGLIRPTLGESGPGGVRSAVHVSAISSGTENKYVIIDGAIYKEGALLPDGRTIKAIERDQVVLAMGDTQQVVPWIHPFRVELRKAVMAAAPAEQEEASPEQGEVAAAEGAVGTQVDVNNLPADLTPDQALEILQKMGKR